MSTKRKNTLPQEMRKMKESIAMRGELKTKLNEIRSNDEIFNKYSFSQMVELSCEKFVKQYYETKTIK